MRLKPVAHRLGVALTQSWGGGDAVGPGAPGLQRQSSWLGPVYFPEEPQNGAAGRCPQPHFPLAFSDVDYFIVFGTQVVVAIVWVDKQGVNGLHRTIKFLYELTPCRRRLCRVLSEGYD